MSEHYKFFQNRECEYFPCHKTNDPEHFNCLFCFCPLYALGERCGGGLQYTESGIKDCSACLFPHRPENYDPICARGEYQCPFTVEASSARRSLRAPFAQAAVKITNNE